MTLVPAYSTVAPATIAAVVEGRYEIAPVTRCRLFRRGRNDTYMLDGGNHRGYVARLSNRRFRGAANVRYETALLMHLHQSGIRVGVPVADRDGNYWCTLDAPEGPRELVVFERLTGHPTPVTGPRDIKNREQNLAGVEALGASLARIHSAGESFDGPASLNRLESPHLLDEPLAQLIEAFDGDFADEARSVVGRLGTRLDERAGSLSTGHCHGDAHPGNSIGGDAADGTPAPGWYDFDDAGPGFLAYDLATFLWAVMQHSPGAAMTDEVRPFWQALVTGYERVRPIPFSDADSVGLLAAVRQFRLMGNHAGTLSYVPLHASWFRQGFDLIRRWEGLAAPSAE